MITYILADDDVLQLDYMQMLLGEFPDLECLATTSNPVDARTLITTLQPDLLILDVEMPGLSGIQLAKSLPKSPALIYVTSHLGYASDAFELDAIDYLSKPVSLERLTRALNKYKKVQVRQGELSDAQAITVDNDSFFVRDKNQWLKFEINALVYIESAGNFSQLHTQEGKKQLVLANLAKMETQLPGNTFVRISRSVIVNKKFVVSLNTEQLTVKDGTELTIGKSYHDQVIQVIVGDRVIKRQ